MVQNFGMIDSISDVFETHAIRITIRDLQATQHEMEGMYLYQNNHVYDMFSIGEHVYTLYTTHASNETLCSYSFFISHCAIHVFIITYIVYFEFQWKN